MILLDTSVLTAAMVAPHIHHDRSLPYLQKVRKGELHGAVSAHSLAECYANLTVYPLSPRIPPETAEKLIHENILGHFQVVDLSAKDYREAIRRVRKLDLKSGAIYDALILQAALKKKADSLYTWNVEDFERFEEPHVKIVKP